MLNISPSKSPHLMTLLGRRWPMELVLIFGVTALLLLSDGFLAVPSQAEMRQYHNGDGVMLHQSRRSLRDLDRHPWQVVVFQQVMSNQENHTELRLVGFPGQVTFSHPASLIIHTRTTQDWLASDEFAEEAPTASVGQFDVTAIVQHLPKNEPLMLEMPTTPPTMLKIPTALVQEWQSFL